MLPLAFPFERGGFRHELEHREGEVCLVRRTNLSTASVHWEVVQVQLRGAEVSQRGVVYPAREVYPGTEEWGEHGWTFTEASVARARMASVCVHRSRARARAVG